MYFKLALMSAFGAAIFNGVAAVLEKITADKQARAHKIQLNFLVKLFSDWPYIIGIILDTCAWVLTLIAVHTLPLFVAQPIFAFGVVTTALVELFVMKHQLSLQIIGAIILIFGGLVLIATTAAPEKAYVVNVLFKWLIWFTPLLIMAAGSLLAKSNSRFANISLGALSGIAFGGTSVTGRMLVFTHPLWHLFTDPTFWALAAYGVVGLLTFSVALQRHHASIVNAASVTFNTVFPMIIGVFFLGDKPRHNEWGIVAIGIILALAGAIIISLSTESADESLEPASA